MQDVPDIKSYTIIATFINRIYTYKTLMKQGNKTLESNATKFKQITIKEHFIQEISTFKNQSNVVTEETPFASSEFSASNLIFVCTQPSRITF